MQALSTRQVGHTTAINRPRATAALRRPTTRAAAHAPQAPLGPADQQPQLTWRIRQARAFDAPAVAQLYAEAFGAGQFPGLEDSPLLAQLEARYAAAIARGTGTTLEDALDGKAAAALAARAYRAQRTAALLRAQLAHAQGLPTSWPTEGPAELRQLARWRRARRFVCLVVEQQQQQQPAPASSSGSSHQQQQQQQQQPQQPAPGPASSSGSSHPQAAAPLLLATATVSMMQAEALLPPPFPSSAPLRPYLSNMAVAPRARRQGIAAALVAACARVARAWGEERLLLHVAASNGAARALYEGCGFELAAGASSAGLSGLVPGPWTQLRMAGDTAQLADRPRARLAVRG